MQSFTTEVYSELFPIMYLRHLENNSEKPYTENIKRMHRKQQFRQQLNTVISIGHRFYGLERNN